MDTQGNHDDDVPCWDNSAAATNLGLDFFSEPPCFPTAASSCGVPVDYPRRASAGVEGLDLNSHAYNFSDHMSYLDLLRSSPAAAVGDGVRDSSARRAQRGVVRPSSRGTGSALANVRGIGASEPRTSGPGRHNSFGARRGAGRRPPTPPTARQFRAPRPAVGQSKFASATSSPANGGFGVGLHDSPESPWSQNPYDEEADDVQLLDVSKGDVFDKADWGNSANNTAFCEICVEEIRAGNRNNGVLTSTAYKNIARKFEDRTGLRHSRQQFKNRWEALRRLYAFWLWLNKQSGLGRGRETVVADDE